MSLHGLAGNALQQQDYTHFDEIAERESFIVVYPQGTQFPLRWHDYERDVPFLPRGNVDDVQFFRNLLARLNDDYCVDPARIYVNGISNGGGMTHRLACELADQIAAMSTVAGAFIEEDSCEPSRPIPVLAFHGTDDPIVPYEGNDEVMAAENWIAGWAERNHCDTDTAALPAAGVVSGIEYTGCAADVILYTIEGGGHTWPGAEPKLGFLLGVTTQDIDATQTMWDFFFEHPLN
jgi:polyhydroxybutyrate depolymerase